MRSLYWGSELDFVVSAAVSGNDNGLFVSKQSSGSQNKCRREVRVPGGGIIKLRTYQHGQTHQDSQDTSGRKKHLQIMYQSNLTQTFRPWGWEPLPAAVHHNIDIGLRLIEDILEGASVCVVITKHNETNQLSCVVLFFSEYALSSAMLAELVNTICTHIIIGTII